jgi:hypothetical protein
MRCGQFRRGLDFNGAHAEVDALGRKVQDEAAGAMDHFLDCQIIGEHGDDHFGVLHGLSHRSGFLSTLRNKGLRLARCAVVDRDLVRRQKQVPGHGQAHVSKT